MRLPKVPNSVWCGCGNCFAEPCNFFVPYRYLYQGRSINELQNAVFWLIFKISHTHTLTHLTAICPGLPGWASTRKVKASWILLKQETVSGSGISLDICKSAPLSSQITMPAPPPGQMPFLSPHQQRQSTEGIFKHSNTHTHLTALFRDYPGESVPVR